MMTKLENAKLKPTEDGVMDEMVCLATTMMLIEEMLVGTVTGIATTLGLRIGSARNEATKKGLTLTTRGTVVNQELRNAVGAVEHNTMLGLIGRALEVTKLRALRKIPSGMFVGVSERLIDATETIQTTKQT